MRHLRLFLDVFPLLYSASPELGLPDEQPKVQQGLRGFALVMLIIGLLVVGGCGTLCVVILSADSGLVSGECRDAIYADFDLSNAHSARRFYVGTALEDWSQGQLAGAIRNNGYLQYIEPCRAEVRAEFDRRGYQW